MDEDAVRAAADALYGVHPGEFIALRGSLAAQRKAAGDSSAAKAIAALRKPNQAAWLVNLLVREEPEQVAGLLDLGAAMRKAQARLSAADLKALSAQRQKLVRSLAGQAFDLAADYDEKVSRAVLNQVEDTLSAALADPECGEAVRLGQLVGPLSYVGFGPAGLSLVPSDPAPDDASVDESDAADVDKARRRAQVEHARRIQEAIAAVTVAHRTLVRAERSLDASTRAREKAHGAAEAAAALVEDLAAQLEAAERAAQACTGRLAEADDALSRDTAAIETARVSVQQAEADLAALQARPEP